MAKNTSRAWALFTSKSSLGSGGRATLGAAGSASASETLAGTTVVGAGTGAGNSARTAALTSGVRSGRSNAAQPLSNPAPSTDHKARAGRREASVKTTEEDSFMEQDFTVAFLRRELRGALRTVPLQRTVSIGCG